MESNPQVFEARYNDVIENRTKDIQTAKNAVAQMMSLQENKKAKYKDLSADVEKKKRIADGAKNQAQKVASKYSTLEEAKQDPEFVKHQKAYADYRSTIEEKESHMTSLMTDIEGYEKQIGMYEKQLKDFQSEISKLKEEKHEAVADLVLSKQEEEINDAIANISVGNSATAELADLRKQRQDAKSRAKISQTLAGADTKSQEDEYLELASSSEFDDDLLDGIQFSGSSSSKPADKMMG